MQDHPDNYERVCCACKKYRHPSELNPCTRKTLINGVWVKTDDEMCNKCQEDELEDKDEVESENDLYESYQRQFDEDHRMAEARKLK